MGQPLAQASAQAAGQDARLTGVAQALAKHQQNPEGSRDGRPGFP